MTGLSHAVHIRCERHIQRLERAHPHLRRVDWYVASLMEAPLEKLARVIHEAWCRAYGSRLRIAYGQALFRLACLSQPEGDGLISWAEQDGHPCGVIVGLPVLFDTNDPQQQIKATLTTGLSCVSEWEGRGMIEMLMARHAAALLTRNHAFSLHWRATEARELHGTARFSRIRVIRLLGRAIRPAIAARYAGSSLLARLAVHLHALRYPAGKSLPHSWTLEINSSRAAFEAARLTRECFADRPVRRRFPAEFFHTVSSFQEDGIRGVVAVFRQAGNPTGVIWGCINPAEEGAFFLLDGMVFTKEIPDENRYRALSCLEEWLGSQGCFAVLAPESVCYPDVPPGWMTLKRYAIGATPFDPPDWFTPEHLAHLFLELR